MDYFRIFFLARSLPRKDLARRFKKKKTSRVSQFFYLHICGRIILLATISPTSPFIQLPDSNLRRHHHPACRPFPHPRAAHSRTPHSVSLALMGCPPPLAPPTGDSRFPPSASSLVGAVNTVVPTVLSSNQPNWPSSFMHLKSGSSSPSSPYFLPVGNAL